MISTNNYYNQISHVNINQLPPTLLKSHELVNKITQDGASWETYQHNATIKSVVDLYLTKLNAYLDKQPKANNEPAAKKQSKTKAAKPVKEKRVKATKAKNTLRQDRTVPSGNKSDIKNANERERIHRPQVRFGILSHLEH